jgi:predicted DNA-binding transcriptional regulator AlpA
VASQQKLSTNPSRRVASSAFLGPSRGAAAGLGHLWCMTPTTPNPTLSQPSFQLGLDPVLTLSQLAAQLGVTVQTLYDLRCQGRGPRGFGVGRELRFRVSEIDAWIARMEADDAAPHPEPVG